MFDMTSLGPSTGPKGDSAARFGEETHRGWKVGQVRRANSIWRSRNQQKKVGFDQDLQKKNRKMHELHQHDSKSLAEDLVFWGSCLPNLTEPGVRTRGGPETRVGGQGRGR